MWLLGPVQLLLILLACRRSKMLRARAQVLTGKNISICLKELYALLSSPNASETLGQWVTGVCLVWRTGFWVRMKTFELLFCFSLLVSTSLEISPACWDHWYEGHCTMCQYSQESGNPSFLYSCSLRMIIHRYHKCFGLWLAIICFPSPLEGSGSFQ